MFVCFIIQSIIIYIILILKAKVTLFGRFFVLYFMYYNFLIFIFVTYVLSNSEKNKKKTYLTFFKNIIVIFIFLTTAVKWRN